MVYHSPSPSVQARGKVLSGEMSLRPKISSLQLLNFFFSLFTHHCERCHSGRLINKRNRFLKVLGARRSKVGLLEDLVVWTNRGLFLGWRMKVFSLCPQCGRSENKFLLRCLFIRAIIYWQGLHLVFSTWFSRPGSLSAPCTKTFTLDIQY